MAQDLLSEDQGRREQAIVRAREKARRGNDVGLKALEEAIRHRCLNEPIEFHQPGTLVTRGLEPLVNASGQLIELARDQLLWKRSPKEIQRLYSAASSVTSPLLLLGEIRKVGGADQALALQLLGTHLIVQATLIASQARG